MVKATPTRLVRLYQSEKGIWRYEIERGGVVRWASLHTRNELAARAAYERMKAVFEAAFDGTS